MEELCSIVCSSDDDMVNDINERNYEKSVGASSISC